MKCKMLLILAALLVSQWAWSQTTTLLTTPTLVKVVRPIGDSAIISREDIRISWWTSAGSYAVRISTAENAQSLFQGDVARLAIPGASTTVAKLLALSTLRLPRPAAIRTSATSSAGTITTGGTAQNLAAANANRSGIVVQNISAGNLFLSVGGTASATAGFLIAPSATWRMEHPNPVSTAALSVFGASTGQGFVVLEQ